MKDLLNKILKKGIILALVWWDSCKVLGSYAYEWSDCIVGQCMGILLK